MALFFYKEKNKDIRAAAYLRCGTSAMDRRFQVLPKPDKSEPPRSGGTGREHHRL